LNPISQALQDLLADPASLAEAQSAVARIFGPANLPGRLTALDRFIAKADNQFPVRSLAVGIANPVQLVSRDPGRLRVLIFNNGPANAVHIGGRQVTIGAQAGDPNAGWPIPANGQLVLDAFVGELFAIAAVAVCDVRILDLTIG
jgi:hypothetical protein